MHIILIGNYKKDNQESMLRFADMLYKGYLKEGIDITIWYPAAFFGYPFPNTEQGIGKWFGYIDKWLLFPLVLRLRLWTNEKARTANFHICDHSNAPYLAHLPRKRTVITCHDVIAIRSSLGFADTEVKVSRFGYYLQKWILKNLKKAHKIVAVSKFTGKQLSELIGNTRLIQQKVIYNSFNASFFRMSKSEASSTLKKAGVHIQKEFILHVGAAHPRKNRKMLVDMVAVAGKNWDGFICFAGEPIDDELKGHAESSGLGNRIFSVVKPQHETLVALYSSCYAFVFPSFSEGFGWPVIEAQACMAPVVASNVSPVPEVGGKGALYCDPKSPEQFAKALLSLSDENYRSTLSENGYENSLRFSNEEMIRNYIRFHEGRQPVNVDAGLADINLSV